MRFGKRRGFRKHQSGIEPPDREGVKRAIALLHRAFPDLRVSVEDLTANGDRVWARLQGRGTHLGEGFAEPTGRTVTLDIMDVCRLREGLIVEPWGVPDRFSQMQQLGLLAAEMNEGRPEAVAGSGRL